MPLIKSGVFASDSWLVIHDETKLPDDGNIIVSFEKAEEEKKCIAGRNGRTGIALPNSIDPVEISEMLPHLDLIALNFPSFTDGRAYSQARQLRMKMGFKGEIRATGTVLADQAAFMESVGFSSFEVAEDQSLEVWNRACTSMSLTYQRGYRGDANAREDAEPAARTS